MSRRIPTDKDIESIFFHYESIKDLISAHAKYLIVSEKTGWSESFIKRKIESGRKPEITYFDPKMEMF